MIDSKVKLVAIVGSTAAGKTALAVQLAEQFGGEIICADSRTLYRGMDIGTAKPGSEDRARVPHHLLDIADPGETVSAAEFKRLAEKAVQEIAARKKVPILAGGSGLYVYSVLYDFQFPAGPRSVEREELERHTLSELVSRLRHLDPERAAEIDLNNKRRVVRALETVGQPRQRRPQLAANCLLLGLRPDEDRLYKRIAQRTEAMFKMGLVDEVARLVDRFGPDLEVVKSPGYAEILLLLQGQVSAEKARELIDLHTRQLVKRQLTWFKRNPEIRWLDQPEQAMNIVSKFLQAKEV